jgi:hypothetical protein
VPNPSDMLAVDEDPYEGEEEDLLSLPEDERQS